MNKQRADDLRKSVELAEQLAPFLERPSTNLPSICPFLYEREIDNISVQILNQHLYIMTVVWHDVENRVRGILITRPAGKALKEFEPRANAEIVLGSRLDGNDQHESAKRMTRNTPGKDKEGWALLTNKLSIFMWKKAREISSVQSDNWERRSVVFNEVCATWSSWGGGRPDLDQDKLEALVREFDIARGLTQNGKGYSAARTEFLGLNSEETNTDRIARMVEEIYFFDRGRGRTGGEAFFESPQEPQKLEGVLLESQRPGEVRSRIRNARAEAKGKSNQDLIKQLDEAIESLKKELSDRERHALSLGVSPEKVELLGGKGKPERAPAASSAVPEPIRDQISIRIRELEVLDWEACNLFLENRIKEKNREREEFTSLGGHQQPAQQQPQAQSFMTATLVRQRDASSSGSSVDGKPRAKEPRQSQAEPSTGPRQGGSSVEGTRPAKKDKGKGKARAE